LSVVGIDAPSVRDASNTLVPVSRAKVSLRIPPGEDPASAMEALVAHLERHAPSTAQVTIHRGEEGKPYRASQDAPAMDLARQSFERAWGAPAVDTGLGGSIPFIADLLAVFPRAEVLVTGVEDHESRAHGIDESLHLGEFAKVCLAEALLLRGAGALDGRGAWPTRRSAPTFREAAAPRALRCPRCWCRCCSSASWSASSPATSSCGGV